MNAGEQAVVDAYGSLRRAVTEHREDLAPFVERNALKAMAALWQVMNGLDLEPGQLYDVGA
jgi:hypothetical protein